MAVCDLTEGRLRVVSRSNQTEPEGRLSCKLPLSRSGNSVGYFVCTLIHYVLTKLFIKLEAVLILTIMCNIIFNNNIRDFLLFEPFKLLFHRISILCQSTM